MPGKVTEVDRGWKRIKRKLLKGSPSYVRVGIQGDEAQEAHGGATNVLVASVHEYGSPSRNIPERSFFRSTFDKYRKKYVKRSKELGQDLIAKKISRASGLRLIGEEHRSDIIDRVRGRRGGKIKQRLSPATVKRRGETGPALYDTGQMIGALSVELEK